MTLLINTNKECLLLDVANIAIIKSDHSEIKTPCIEISCNNHEVYRISYSHGNTKNAEKFVAYCCKIVNTIYDGQRQGRHSFVVSFYDYETLFEKNSFNSCID